jgi:glycosyltransferase involved in cell wall biosynthesis
LRFILVSGIYYPDIGGPATYIPKLANFLVDRGDLIETLSLRDNSKVVLPSEPWRRHFVCRNLPKIIRQFVVIARLISLSQRYQGILANGLHEEVAVSTLITKKPAVAKVVGDPIWERFRNAQGSTISIKDFQNSKLPIPYKVQRKFLTWSLNRFQFVTTPSKELAEYIASWGVKSEIRVIPNGVRCADASPSRDNDLVSVVSVSRLVNWKNVDCLIRATSLANLKLVIVGSGPELNYLQDLANNLNANVEFTGDLERHEVTEKLRNADIYALISDYEGLSFSLLEAMMMGKSILASDNRGNSDVITDEVNGIVVPVRSVQDTFQALDRLLKDPHLRVTLSNNAHKEAIEKYCEENRLTEMRSVMMKSLGQ